MSDAATRDRGALHVALDRDEAAQLRRVHDLQRSLGLEAEWLPPRALPRARAGPDPVLQRRRPRARRGRDRPARADRGAAGRARRARAAEVRTGVRGRPTALSTTASGSPGSRTRGRRGAARPATSSSPPAPGPGATAWLPEDARPPVRPVKGQILELRGRGRAPPPCERIVASERVYLVPRPDGRLIVGATVEERGFDTTVTAGGVHELLREAYRLLPDVAEMELVEAIAGLRPGHPGQPAADRPGRGRGPAPRRPATSATASCWRRSPPSASPPPRRRVCLASHTEANRSRSGGRAMRIELNGEAGELADGRDARRRGARGRRRARAPWRRRRPRRRGRAARRSGSATALARGPAGRGAGRDPGRRAKTWELGGREWGSRLIAGTGGFRSLEQMEAALRRLGRRDRHRRPAPHRPRRQGLGPRRARPARPLRPAQHGRLLHRPRRRPHRAGSPARPSRPTGSSSR